tara:strand:- start:255 stop:728 length:474 start_codon:yes stop_codon:yes gene_type:complete
MLKRTILTVTLIAPALSNAAIYQCKVNGQTIFSDQPCGNNAKEIEVRAPARTSTGAMVTEGSNRFMEERRLQREIRSLEREKDDLKKGLDRAMLKWQRQKSRANNNLAGATWEKALAEEAEVIRKRYQSEIDDIDRQLDRKREELAEVNKAPGTAKN